MKHYYKTLLDLKLEISENTTHQGVFSTGKEELSLREL